MDHPLIFPPHKCGLHLHHNPHKDIYSTIEEYEKYNQFTPDDWVSDEQRTKALASNDFWLLRYYPETPIGSRILLACDLLELLSVANEDEDN